MEIVTNTNTNTNTNTSTNEIEHEKEDTRMNECNLKLLINPLYQKGIVKTEKEKVNHSKRDLKDLKFYRKRILALTNDYIKGNYEQHGTANEALKEQHVDYVYNVIQYLKMTDKIDIIQNELGISIPPTSTPTPSSSPMPMLSADFISQPEKEETVDPLYKAAQLNVKRVNTLDSYVKRTKGAVNNNPITIPVNRVINYHVPELKNKGVKEKII